MVPTLPFISKSSNLLTNPLGTVLSAPITIGTTVTFMFIFFLFFSKVPFLLLLFTPFEFFTSVLADGIIIIIIYSLAFFT